MLSEYSSLQMNCWWLSSVVSWWLYFVVFIDGIGVVKHQIQTVKGRYVVESFIFIETLNIF